MVDDNNDTSVSGRYRAAEEVFHNQLVSAQDTLTRLLETAATGKMKVSETSNMGRICKDLLGNYNETVRLRKLAEIEEGRLVPMSAVERYQREVLPTIASGIDNLRLDILNGLAPANRPEFETNWKIGYKKFVAILRDAAVKMDEYINEAQQVATGKAANKGGEAQAARRMQVAASKREVKASKKGA